MGNPKLKGILILLGTKKTKDLSMRVDGILRFQNIICVLKHGELKQVMLSKSHKSKFNLQPGMTKMYQDLRKSYWWLSMNVDACCTFQKSKV